MLHETRRETRELKKKSQFAINCGSQQCLDVRNEETVLDICHLFSWQT